MVIKKAKQSVKGTTKVSFGDRLMIKKLFMANRNSKQKKQKRAKEVSQDYTLQIANAPLRLSKDAFQHWYKKARDKELTFEFQETDDVLAVTAMCQPEWDKLMLRQTRMQTLAQSLQELASSSSGAAIKQNLTTMADMLWHDSQNDLPLLNAPKHKRASNYRRKVQRKINLLDAHVSSRATDPMYHQQIYHQQNGKEQQLILCEPVPSCDFEQCNSSIYHSCTVCGEPVCSTEMKIQYNGTFDAIFLHPACSERE